MNKWIDKYTKWISLHVYWVLAIITLITVGLASQLLYFTINPTPYFLDRSHPSRIADDNVSDTFTNTGEYAFIVVENPAGSIFTPKSLHTISQLSSQLETLSLLSGNESVALEPLGFDKKSRNAIRSILKDGLGLQDIYPLHQLGHYATQHDQADTAAFINNLISKLQPVKKVRSIATMEDLSVYEEAGEQVLDSFALMETVPDTAETSQLLEARIMSNPIYHGLLINHPTDKGVISSSSIQIELAIDKENSPTMIAAYNAINRIVDPFRNASTQIYLSGPPMISAQISHEMESNNIRLMPYVILVVFIILFLSFKSLQGVYIPLIIAVITTLWTMSIMAALRVPQNIITTALPVFLISIAVADAIHFLSVYYTERQYSDKEKAINYSFKHLIAPLFITSLTTMAGFIAVSNTDIIFMKEFGLFVAIGIALAFILTITLLPILLLLFDNKSDQQVITKRANGASAIARIAVSTLMLVEQKRGWAVVSLLSLFILAGFGLWQLKVDSQMLSNFAKDSPIRVDSEYINTNFGGTVPLSIVLSAQEEGTFIEPDTLAAIDKLATALAELPTVGYVYSIADMVKRSYQQQENTDYKLPNDADRATIAQYLFIYENAEQQEIRDIINLSYDKTRIVITMNKDQSSEVDKVIDQINRLAPELFPDTIDYQITGFGELLSTANQEIVINQFDNNFLALGIIFIIMLLLLRSFVLAFIGIIPLACTVYFIFSLMGAVGIPLDIGTALVSCITFGIGIDYAIHFIVILKRECQDNQEALLDALKSTMKQVASPIVINSFSLAAGLLVMVTAEYIPIVNLGLIIASAMVICALITLVLLPLLVLLIKPRVLMKGPALAMTSVN